MSVAPKIYDISCSEINYVRCTKSRCLFVEKKYVVRCSKLRRPLLQNSLPVALNFVARRYKFRCPWFFTPLPVVFHAVARENLRRRPRLDHCAKKNLLNAVFCHL